MYSPDVTCGETGSGLRVYTQTGLVERDLKRRRNGYPMKEMTSTSYD